MPSYALNVNGGMRTVEVRDPDEPLLYVLRNALRLTGAKFGCGLGQCGACTVLVDGEAGALLPHAGVECRRNARVTPSKGSGRRDKPHPVQAAFIAEQAAQCGYCANGMVMTGAALLARKPEPTLRGGEGGAGRQSLPLRHASADPARGDARRGEGDDMNAHALAPRVAQGRRRARRRLRLPVTRPSAAPRAATAALGKTLDTAEVDGFFAVHADGSVTLYCGKVDLGTGCASRSRRWRPRSSASASTASRWSRATPR